MLLLLGWPNLALADPKQIVFGGNKDLFPYEYLDFQKKPKGFNVELIQAIAKINGWKPVIKLMKWTEAEEALRSGDVDVLLGQIYSAGRQDEFSFSKAHSNIEFSFFTPKEARPIFSLEDLKGRVIGLHEIGITDETSKALAGFRQVIFNDTNKMFSALSSGLVDVVFCPKAMGLHWVEKRGEAIITHDNPILLYQYCFAVSKHNSVLLEELDEALRKLKESGEYYKLSSLLIYNKEKTSGLLFYSVISFSIIVCFFALFLFFLKKRRNIQHILAVSFLGIGILIVLLIGILNFISEQNLIKKKVSSQLRTVAELKATALSQWLERSKSACRSIGKDLIYSDLPHILNPKSEKGLTADRFKKIRMEQLRSYLRGLLAGWRYEEVLITDAEGTVRLSTNPLHEGLKIDSSPEYWGAMTLPPGEIYITDIHHSPLSRGISISFSTGIESLEPSRPWGATLGVVILRAAADKTIYPLLQTWPSRQDSSEILLLRRDADRVMCLNNARLTPDMALRLAFPVHSKTGMVETISKALNGESGVSEFTDYRGVPVFAAFSSMYEPISQTVWALLVKQDKGESLDEINKILGRNYFILVVLISALSVLAFLVAGYLAKPIKILEELARRIARGDIQINPKDTERIRKSRIEELRHLTESFENMIQSLRERFTRSEKMSALGKLSGGLAHEIRTPLTSIKVILQSLEKQPNITSDQFEDIALARQEIDRLNELVTRFLRFAQPAKVNFAKVDINQLLVKSLQLLQPKMDDNKIQKQLDLHMGLEPIAGDERKLSNVFLNVYLNAIEAMPEGGTLSIRTEACSKEKTRPSNLNGPFEGNEVDGRGVRISISDNGAGISAENIQNVFDPFFTTKEGGTGLGLSIAFNIIEGHNGQIKAESAPQQGTTIHITLPINQKES